MPKKFFVVLVLAAFAGCGGPDWIDRFFGGTCDTDQPFGVAVSVDSPVPLSLETADGSVILLGNVPQLLRAEGCFYGRIANDVGGLAQINLTSDFNVLYEDSNGARFPIFAHDTINVPVQPGQRLDFGLRRYYQ